jgi:hypothetical protein
VKTKEKKPKLKIISTDGNAFAILGKARRVAIENKLDWNEIHKEATAGDYDHLLATMTKYFNVT